MVFNKANMKIGLFFGSFNPIHTGHLIIANYMLENSDLKEVWFVLSPQNPEKSKNSLLNKNHRLNLIKTAIEDNIKLKASNIEFSLPTPSYTSITLMHLSEKYPKKEFVIIMGSDSYSNLKNWYNVDYILNNYFIYIYKRLGFEKINLITEASTFFNTPIIEISSTLIRKHIKEKKSIKYLVPNCIEEIILNNKYYS
jgi:nicotinate-nucleotide adenylyltransferase